MKNKFQWRIYSSRLRCFPNCSPSLREEYIADIKNPVPNFIEYRLPDVDRHNLVIHRDSRKSTYQIWIHLKDRQFRFVKGEDPKTIEIKLGDNRTIRMYQDNGKLPLVWVFAGKTHGAMAVKWNGNEDNDSE